MTFRALAFRQRDTDPVNPIEILVIKYVFIDYHIVREEMNFVPLSHDIVTFDVDRDVSTAILLVFIR